MAQSFDDRRLELSGEPVPVGERLGSFLSNGFFSASANGVLVYRTGTSAGQTSQLTWFDRQGRVLRTIGVPGLYLDFALSPDGTRVAASRNDDLTGQDIRLLDVGPGTSSRFTLGGGVSLFSVWSPDGRRIIFRSNRDGRDTLYQKPTNGSTDEEPLLKSDENKIPTAWSRDGRFLLYTVADPRTKSDLWVLPLDGERKPVPFLRTDFNEDQGRFSPDGRWVAYRSDESGRRHLTHRSDILAAAGDRFKLHVMFFSPFLPRQGLLGRRWPEDRGHERRLASP